MSSVENITKAIAGDKKAIRKVIEDYSEEIYKLIYLHIKDEDESKEVLTKISNYVRENIKKLDDANRFKIWIYNLSIVSINSFLKEIGVNLEKKRDKYYYENDKISLYRAIDLLEPKYKNVVILKYYFDFSVDDICKILNLNEETVNIYIRQSLKEMKSSVGESL